MITKLELYCQNLSDFVKDNENPVIVLNKNSLLVIITFFSQLKIKSEFLVTNRAFDNSFPGSLYFFRRQNEMFLYHANNT